MRPEICLSFEEIALAMMFIFSSEVDNIIKKSKNQTDNIILDITNTKISRDSIIKQVQKVFSTSGREWVKTIMIIDNYHLLKIYQRK